MLKSQLFSLPERDLDHILSEGASEIAELRGKSIFITGGTGFFGKWLLGALGHANAQFNLRMRLSVLSRNPDAFRVRHPEVQVIPGLNFVRGDVSSFSVEQYMHPEYIIHAAADTTAFTSNLDELTRSHAIVAGTWHMLEFANYAKARMLNVSSGAVYGAAAGQPGGAREEDYAVATVATPYATAKREAEEMAPMWEVDLVTARAFAFLGPHLPLDTHFAAGNFLRNALAGGPILVRGDGTAQRSYLYPADLVVWLLRMLVRGKRGAAYNVGSDEVVTTKELATLMAGSVAPPAEVQVQSTQAHGAQNIYLPDISLARRELGLEVAVPLREAIARTLEFYR